MEKRHKTTNKNTEHRANAIKATSQPFTLYTYAIGSDTLDKLLEISFPFHDNDALKSMANGFNRYQPENCTLAIDGWVCRTRQPFVWETEFPSSYRNRHECFGIVILGGFVCGLAFQVALQTIFLDGSCRR